MSKLKLHLEDLSVESFETRAEDGKRKGTVFGRDDSAATFYPCESQDVCDTLQYSCPGDCLQSFQPSQCLTCFGTCESCRGTSCLQPSECLGCTQYCTSPGDCDA